MMGGSFSNKKPSDLHGSLVMERLEMDLGKLLRDDTVRLSLVDTLHIAQVGNVAGICMRHGFHRKNQRQSSSCMLVISAGHF
jgi:hypothetical protein